MQIFSVIIISLLSIFAFLLLVFHIKSRRPLRSAATNALLGLAALAVVNLTFRFTGVRIPVNVYTVPGTAIFGVPFACALVVMEVIM